MIGKLEPVVNLEDRREVVAWRWRKKYFSKRSPGSPYRHGGGWFTLSSDSGGSWLAWRDVPHRSEDGQTMYTEGSQPVTVAEYEKLDKMLAERMGGAGR